MARPSFRRSISFVCTALLLGLVFSGEARATLGEDVSSVQSDQQHLKAAAQTITRPLYTIRRMETPAGTAIQQYVSPEGMVFAVSWEGAAPDLKQLLGRYFDEYVASPEGSRRGRGVHIDDGDLVIETGGHMRFVTGRAYLRSKMPQGMISDEIR